MVEQALAGAQISDMTKLEAVAVAMGPGSHVCLRVGIDFAQAIGAKFDIPVIPVNHIEAHLMTARMEAVANLEEGAEFEVEFPFLSVVVTGKHTEIILTRGIGLHTVLGFSMDIALGTLLDRCAKHVV